MNPLKRFYDAARGNLRDPAERDQIVDACTHDPRAEKLYNQMLDFCDLEDELDDAADREFVASASSVTVPGPAAVLPVQALDYSLAADAAGRFPEAVREPFRLTLLDVTDTLLEFEIRKDQEYLGVRDDFAIAELRDRGTGQVHRALAVALHAAEGGMRVGRGFLEHAQHRNCELAIRHLEPRDLQTGSPVLWPEDAIRPTHELPQP